MKGEYGDRLQWPFRGDITIQLVNQISDQYQYEKSLDFTNAPLRSSQRVSTDELFIEQSWGWSQFVSHATKRDLPLARSI